MAEYEEAVSIAARVEVHAIEEGQAAAEAAEAAKISAAYQGYRVRKERRQYQELLRLRRDDAANRLVVAYLSIYRSIYAVSGAATAKAR